jgi:hypothetical protein
MEALEDAQPPVRLRPDSIGLASKAAQDLRKSLREDSINGVIPLSLKVSGSRSYSSLLEPSLTGYQCLLEKADPNFEDIPSTAFDSGPPETTPGSQRLWEDVQSIYNDAVLCERHLKDENAWTQVAWALFKLAIKESNSTLLEVNSVYGAPLRNHV